MPFKLTWISRRKEPSYFEKEKEAQDFFATEITVHNREGAATFRPAPDDPRFTLCFRSLEQETRAVDAIIMPISDNPEEPGLVNDSLGPPKIVGPISHYSDLIRLIEEIRSEVQLVMLDDRAPLPPFEENYLREGLQLLELARLAFTRGDYARMQRL